MKHKKTTSPGSRSAPSVQEPSDDAEFRTLVEGVIPLKPASIRVPPSRTARRGAVAKSPEPDLPLEIIDDGIKLEARRSNVSAATLQRLRRGAFPIDARVDLHGMTAAVALSSLDSFLRSARQRGERCILVVHGKGLHSVGGVGVLRAEVAVWLAQAPVRRSVAAFATAIPSDGGTGAVYVLLHK